MRKIVPKPRMVDSTIKCILTLFFLLAFAPLFSLEHARANGVAAMAQTVSGQVLDSDGNQPLPGVSIQLKGTNTGTTTDVDGRYSLEVPNAEAILVFSFVGYIPQEIKVGNSTQLNVMLIIDSKALGGSGRHWLWYGKEKRCNWCSNGHCFKGFSTRCDYFA